MPWDPPEISTDVDEVTDRTLAGMAETMDGWEEIDGAPEVAIATELGREVALLNQYTVTVLELAFAGIGETVHQFPADPGSAAAIAVTLTVTAAGVTVPAGFQVVGVNSDGTEVAFELLTDATSTGTSLPVTMHATSVGYVGNDVPAGPLTITVATATVIAADATAASAGGVDPETVAEYLDRYVDYVSTLRPGGVNATDIAALARSVSGVHRAFAIDLYDPADPEEPAEKTVSVFLVDEQVLPVDEDVADAVQAQLEAVREVNFVFHVLDPSFTQVEISYAVVAETGADPAVVEAAVNAAATSWLAGWGSTTDDDTAWVEGSTIRYLQVAQVIGSAPGVAYLESITINGVAADLELDGVAPLPTSPFAAVDPSTVSGTVVVP